MSGIGLPLDRTTSKGTYIQGAASYLSAVVLTAGPWLSAVLALALLDGAMTAYLSPTERTLLFMTITYGFITSMVLASGPQAIVTRYLSDRLYLKDSAVVTPICVGVLFGVLPLALFATPFLFMQQFDWRYRLIAVTLFLALSLIWMMMAFVSATRAQARTAFMIITSYAVSLLAGVGFGRSFGFLGTLAGFTLGQVFCLGLLVSNVYLDFPMSLGVSFDFLGYLRRYTDLFFIGLLYAASIWADNAVFWLTPQAVTLGGVFRTFPPYDIAKLVGYLLTIPASAAFFLRIETQFAPAFREYSLRIEQGGTYHDIRQAKQRVVAAARAAIVSVVKVQGVVMIGALLFTPALASFLHMTPNWIPLLRVMIVAGSCNYFVLMSFLFLSYMDDRKASLRMLLLYFCSNVILTAITVWLGPSFYGLGYLFSSILAALLGLYYLRTHLRQLEYVTFMLQPVA
jgi:uncharacterized membrane protein